jgi:hypothetical protein
VWLGKIQVRWATTSAVGTRFVSVDWIDNRADADGNDSLMWSPGYQSGISTGADATQTAATVNASGFGGGMQITSRVFRVLDTVAPAAVSASIFQDSGGALAFTSGNVMWMKIG